MRNPIALPNLPNIPARPFFRDAHPTSLALKMRTDGQRAVRFALSGAEDIYARRWRTVAESGSIVWCAEGVFEYSEWPGPVHGAREVARLPHVSNIRQSVPAQRCTDHCQ